tara:strand:- start:110 stop:2437 length:2328 start_codon:yes stop_codon:yes gene_type:complete
MPYIENVNKQWCENLSNISFYDFALLYAEYKDEKVEHDDLQSVFTTTINTCKHFIKNNYEKTTSYSQNDGIARQFAKGFSIQKLCGMIRNTLCEGIYRDFDMQNAHPRLLENLCKKHLIDCPYLSFFNSNREKCYDNLYTELDNYGGDLRSYVKTLFIKSINSEWLIAKHHLKGKRKIKDDNFIKFDSEIKDLQTKLMDLYPKFVKKINFKKKTGNKKGIFIAYLLQNEENEILNKVIAHKDIPDASVLMYDGFLINNSLIDADSDIIAKLNKITEEDGIIWSEKPIKSPIMNELNKMEFLENQFSPYMSNIPHSHADFLLHNQFKNRLYKCDGTYYFKAEKQWINDEKTIQKQLIKEIVKFELYFKKENLTTGEWEILHIRTNLQLMKDIVYLLTCLNDNDNNLLDRIYDHTKNKLYFNNCVYNFTTDETETNDYDSFIIIDRDLDLTSNKSVREEIYNKVFNPIFGCFKDAPDYKVRTQLRDNFIMCCARTLAGCIEDKEWCVLSGNRNCGKGVLNDFLTNTFGAYVRATNTENFVYKKNNDETARANGFMLNLQFQRIILANEMSVDSNGSSTFDGNKIKKFHSGGDYIQARGLYQKETNFRLQGRCFFSMNDVPIVKPSDAMEKCLHYEFNSKFIKKGEKKKYSNVRYLEADDSIKSVFLRREDVLNEFALIIIDAYKTNVSFPKELKIEQNEDLENDDDRLINLFDFTEISEDRITTLQLKSILTENKINFTSRKATSILVGRGAKKFNNKGRGVCGLRIHEEENEEDLY